MCGRFFRYRKAREMAAAFRANPSAAIEDGDAAHYNIPPSQLVLAVRFNAKTGERSLDPLHWGLIPHFAKDRKYAFRCSNARADSIADKASFRGAFAKRRCIVPADGFYEWLTLGKKKLPYAFVRADRAPLALAGVWENWMDPETGEWVRSCALITTEANDLVGRIHDRMPVILHPDDQAAWLGEEPASVDQLKQLLAPYPADTMAMWAVSPRLNKPDVDEPTLLEPVEDDPLRLAMAPESG
jgi:putative SOS response-associated peptidase YedK